MQRTDRSVEIVIEDVHKGKWIVMDMFRVVLINILIIVLLSWLLSPGKRTEKKAKDKFKDEMKKVRDGKYTIRYSLKLRLFTLIGLLMFSTAFVVCLGNELGWWHAKSELWTTILFGCFVLFFLYAVGGICIWRIRVDGEDVEYRNMFGITRHYKASEIDQGRMKKTKTEYYSKGKKIITIDDNVSGNYLDYTILASREKQIKIEEERAAAAALAENPAAFENLPDSRENRNGKKNKGKDKNRKNTDSKKKKR